MLQKEKEMKYVKYLLKIIGCGVLRFCDMRRRLK